MNLEEKRAEIHRNEGFVNRRKMPVSDTQLKEWNARLKEMCGVDRHGDQRIRLVWGGTEQTYGLTRNEKGLVEGLRIKYPAPIRFVQVATGYHYRNEEWKTVYVVRPDEIPKTAQLITPVIEIVELGHLRWYLERKMTAEELVEAQFYPDPNTDQGKEWCVQNGKRYRAVMDNRGEYIPLAPLETWEGAYDEPSEQWFAEMARAAYDAENADAFERHRQLADKFEREAEAEIKAAEYKREQQDVIFEETLIEVEKAPKGLVRSFGK